MIKAIETRYKGYRFRSRLEARWAVFFDAMGIEWLYEHEGYKLPSGLYLPDFWLPQVEMYAEIKPGEPTSLEAKLCEELCLESRKDVVICDGMPSYGNYLGWRFYGEAPTPDSVGFIKDNTFFPYRDQPIADSLNWFFCCKGFWPEKGYFAHLLYGPPIERSASFWDNGREKEDYPAVALARAARFEHGENG